MGKRPNKSNSVEFSEFVERAESEKLASFSSVNGWVTAAQNPFPPTGRQDDNISEKLLGMMMIKVMANIPPIRW